MQIYLVGGAVRDELLGLKPHEHDWVVVGASPQELLDKGFQQVGKDFPVFLHPDTKEEYALARTERKAGKGYHGFEVFADPSVTLEDDLIRRDLTINAIAKSDEGELIDPYGGVKDLEDRKLRHVSDAFVEDPLRVLRVARFAAKLAPFGFTLAEETRALMQEMVHSGELSDLTPERVWQEVTKALKTAKPSIFFEVLNEVGAVAVLFPELYQLHDVTQPVQYHPEGDVWIHTMMVLDAAADLSDSLNVRFAALVHDLGKGITPKELWPKHHGHEKAGLPLVKAMSERYRLPKQTLSFALKVTEYHGIVHKVLDSEGKPHLKPQTCLKLLNLTKAFKQTDELAELLTACEADARGRLGFENRPYPQKAFWLALAEAGSQVDNQAILATGVQGAEIAEAIERKRIELIEAYMTHYAAKTDGAANV
ncbi:multifunctional CCA addition/repair protein [Hydrogenovibrio sp. JE_KL2]|uniref:multifunctional CCA addition/repair protein n=1 Tax=Hydrogenovibrio sp. JE_KL2 TaxID=2651188 RepID=UPI00128B8483|nr:multifunctional CCA addition/repair protein [Hydrogenovibrio sp. JE_KL2]MPQ77370.1 multifunctional CCA addition/repair protein [Hydrogenovibrio sp. JE_KL2]